MDLDIADVTGKRKREEFETDEDKENRILVTCNKEEESGNSYRIHATFVPKKTNCRLLNKVRKSNRLARRSSCKLSTINQDLKNVSVFNANASVEVKTEPIDVENLDVETDSVNIKDLDVETEPVNIENLDELFDIENLEVEIKTADADDTIHADDTKSVLKRKFDNKYFGMDFADLINSKASLTLQESNSSTSSEALNFHEKRFAVIFENFPEGVSEHKIKKTIDLAVDPHEVVFISMAKKLFRLYGNGFIIVNSIRALKKLLGLTGIKMKGKPIKFHQGILKFDNLKKSNNVRKGKSKPNAPIGESEIQFLGFKMGTKEEIYSDVDARKLFMDS